MTDIVPLRQRRHPLLATWVAIGNRSTAEVLCNAGFHALVIDLQHGAISGDELGAIIQVIDLNRVPALVRVASADSVQIMRALDLGAAGVIVPMVSTVAEARAVVAAMRYPPRGTRSFGKVRSYYSEAQEAPEPLCLVMIETREGMDNMDTIAAVDGVDGLFVGPVDLGLALGEGVVLTRNERILTIIGQIASVCARHGKVCASASFDAAYTEALLERDVQLIVQGSDLGLIRRGAAEMVAQFRNLQ